ncbi:MAG: hypothetical protein Q8R04_05465 [Nanoarchaeota archaeon]|nr:hypothetical protein [Nanoarchaeota archaeon]
MNIETIISVLGLLGIGGIIGSYLQHLWNQKRETESKIQNINEKGYRSTLIFMRCVLKPENLNQFHIEDQNMTKLKSREEIREYAKAKLMEFYYADVLYAPDDVLIKIRQFMKNPSEINFVKTAIAMRKDLWKKKTKIDLKNISLD